MKKYISLHLFFILMGPLVAQENGKMTSILDFQKNLNESFSDPGRSPLKGEDLETFRELEFFPVDTTLYIVAEFVRTPFETPFSMPTNTERKPMYLKFGEAYFKLNGKEYQLNLYQDLQLIQNPEYQNYLFLPFTDPTNGSSTYAGGRYLDLEIPVSPYIIIDFNKAYNPYCAYNGEYSCPIPPPENHLEIPIQAGVMLPNG